MKILFACILIVLLLWRFHTYFQEKPAYKDGQNLQIQVTLQEEPELSNKGQKFSVTDPYNQTIYVTAAAFPRLQYGEVIVLKGILSERLLDDGRITYSIYQPEVAVLFPAHDLVSGYAKEVRERSKSVFEASLPPISASLLMGIVFGSKEHFPEEVFDALQATGVLHVIAASGMNVTFVSAALLYGFGYFMRRQFALILGCFGIIFYLFLVGFEPSILRASIMGILAFGASLFGRQHVAAYAVLVSAAFMLLWQPGFLFDLGFQLSFLATLGIIFVKPLITLPQNFFTESITTTFAAQVGTLPILLGVFGQFGLLSLLVNALVLWTIPIVMLVGSVAAILGLLIPQLGQVIVLITLPFLTFFEFVILSFGQNSWVLQIPHMPIAVWVAYYLILIVIVLRKKPSRDVKPSLFSDL